MLIRNSHETADLHVDFVPMVDVLFNLLIFFLLATSMAQSERETRVALPYTSSAGPITAAVRQVVLNIDAQGVVYVAGKPITDESLSALLIASIAANPEQKVSVRGDRSAAYAHIARVLDLCKRAGIQQPYLESIPLGSAPSASGDA